MAKQVINYKSLNDNELVRLVKDKDYPAFEEIVERYSSKVMRLALKMARNREDAQDILQDTFVSIYKNIGNFRGESALSSWIFRIAANFALMKIRSKKYDSVSDSLDENPNMDIQKLAEHSHSENDWSDQAEKILLRKELREKINKAIEKLPEEFRIVFLLKDVDGLSNEEIAESLNLTIPAVKSRLHRARLFLRKEISKYLEEQ